MGFISSLTEFEKDRLGKIKSLDECVVKGRLHDKEDQWKEMCETRFGLSVSHLISCFDHVVIM